MDAVEKSNKPVSAQLKDELARATADKERFEKGIEAKNQEKEALRNRYAEQRKRYIELRNNPARRRNDAGGVCVCFRLGFAQSEEIEPARSGRRRSYDESLRFSIAFTCCGFALPFVAFMTWPTSALNAFSFPAR